MVGHAAAGTGRLRRNGPPSARPDRRGGTAEGGARAWSGTDRGRPDLRALVALPVGGVESGRTRLRGRRHHLGGPGAALADRGEPGTARRTTRGHGGGQPARRIAAARRRRGGEPAADRGAAYLGQGPRRTRVRG